MSVTTLDNSEFCTYYEEIECHATECSTCSTYYKYKKETDEANKRKREVYFKNVRESSKN